MLSVSDSPSAYHSKTVAREKTSKTVAREFQIEIQLVVDPAGFWFNPRQNSNPIVVIFYDRAVTKLKVNIFS